MLEAMAVLIPLVLWWGIPIYVAAELGSRGDYKNAWLWALVLGWIGVLIVAIKTGPARQQRIREEAAREEVVSGEDEETRKLRTYGLD
jgi:hypothetical protein